MSSYFKLDARGHIGSFVYTPKYPNYKKEELIGEASIMMIYLDFLQIIIIKEL
jgi:hypothetical protein